MERKIRVGVIFGGKSGEHEVSLRSAAAIISAIDKSKYEVIPLGITKQGRLASSDEVLAMLGDAVKQAINAQVVIQSYDVPDKLIQLRPIVRTSQGASNHNLDVVFPVMHGPYGEDGSIQGLLELADIPYVGCSVLSSALGMDKDIQKRVFLQFGLPVVEFATYLTKQWHKDSQAICRQIEGRFGYPCFVKPSSLGSSIAVAKAYSREQLIEAMNRAGRFDRKIIVERAIDARELECAVLGNDEPQASVVGEVIPAREFYDYEAKYMDPRTRLMIPAEIEADKAETVRSLAIRAFKALDCSGLARVDFFLERSTGQIFINEINTMPGFTQVSMYPKLWEASGIPFPELIDRLITLAFERYQQKANRAISRFD